MTWSDDQEEAQFSHNWGELTHISWSEDRHDRQNQKYFHIICSLEYWEWQWWFHDLKQAKSAAFSQVPSA